MPEAVAFIATTGVEIAGIEIATATLIKAALIIGAAQSARSKAAAAARAARNAYNASLTDRQVTVRSGVEPRAIVYGRAPVSGPVVFAHSNGAKKEYLHIVLALGAHEFDAIEKIYFNEVELPALDGSGFVTSGPFAKSITHSETESVGAASTQTLAHSPTRIVSVTQTVGAGADVQVTTLTSPSGYTIAGSVLTYVGGTGNYTVNYEWVETQPVVRIKVHLGTASQTADADLIAESDGKWTSAHRGDGVPYLYLRLKYDQDVFGQVGLPNIKVLARGKKTFDPRTGTTVWSENWALCTADYLRDAVFGLGCTSAQVPNAEVTTAANIADETVALDGAGATQKRYTVNGAISTAVGQRDILNDLLAAGAGSAVWVQGRWLLRAGAHRASEATLDESWLAGGTLQLAPRMPRSELFNAVSGKFIDPAQNYAEAQIPTVVNATYQARDGGRRKVRNIVMPLVNDSKRAQRLAKIELERERRSYTIAVTCNLKAYDTLPGSVLAVNLARYGASQLMQVLRREYDPAAQTVRLVMRQTDSAVWDWAFGEATTSTPPNTTLPTWGRPAILAGLGVDSTSGVQLEQSTGAAMLRAKVTWTQSVDVFVVQGGWIEIEYKTDNAAEWVRAAPVTGDRTVAYIQPLEQLRKTLVRVRAVSQRGQQGPWEYVLHTPQSSIAIPDKQLGAGSATDTVVARNAAGTINSVSPDFNVVVTSTVNTITWTNPLGRTVKVQIEHTVFGALTQTGAGTGSMWYVFDYSISSGGGAGATHSQTEGVPGSGEKLYSFADEVIVGAGLTLTVRLLAKVVITSGTGVTNTWRAATSRAAAIKA